MNYADLTHRVNAFAVPHSVTFLSTSVSGLTQSTAFQAVFSSLSNNSTIMLSVLLSSKDSCNCKNKSQPVLDFSSSLETHAYPEILPRSSSVAALALLLVNWTRKPAEVYDFIVDSRKLPLTLEQHRWCFQEPNTFKRCFSKTLFQEDDRRKWAGVTPKTK